MFEFKGQSRLPHGLCWLSVASDSVCFNCLVVGRADETKFAYVRSCVYMCVCVRVHARACTRLNVYVCTNPVPSSQSWSAGQKYWIQLHTSKKRRLDSGLDANYALFDKSVVHKLRSRSDWPSSQSSQWLELISIQSSICSAVMQGCSH